MPDLPLVPGKLRCQGLTCRPRYFPSLTTYTNFGENVWCSPQFNASCWIAPELFFILMSLPLADGFGAFVMAFKCIEQKFGIDGLTLLAENRYNNLQVTSRMVECLEREVSFQGNLGTVEFSTYHAPKPGSTVIELGQANVNQRNAAVSGVYLPQAGEFLLTSRVFSRPDSSRCVNMKSELPPAYVCPHGASWEYAFGNSSVPPVSLGAPEVCPAGQYPLPLGINNDALLSNLFACVPCPAGTFKQTPSDQLCAPCAPGFASTEGSATCTACLVNQLSASTIPSVSLQDGRVQMFGSTACSSCPAGRIAPGGSTQCSACPAGTHRDMNSVGSCEACAPGTYSPREGSAACLSCGDVLPGSSSFGAASSASQCVCSQNQLRLSTCTPCPVGLICDGTSVPQQAAGAWAVVDSTTQSFSVIFCRDDLQCPEGPIGSCAAGRTGQACNNCMKNYYKSSSGQCSPCQGSNLLPVIFVALLLPGLFAVMVFSFRVSATTQRLPVVTFMITLTQMATAVQALGAIRLLNIGWTGPIRTLINGLAFFSFDIDILQVSCAMPDDNPVAKLLLKLLLFPILSAVILLAWFVSYLIGRRSPWDTVLNLSGTVLMTIFITLTLVALLPYQCRDNPNGSITMVSEPGIVCWTTGQHKAMTIIGAFGLLCYPASILAGLSYSTYKFSRTIVTGHGLSSLSRFRFLYNNYRVECYYFPMIYLLRNLIIAIVPAAFLHAPFLQLPAMGLVIMLGSVLQAVFWPWRTNIGNWMDILMSCGLVSVLLCAGPLVFAQSGSTAQLQDAVGVEIFVVVILMFVAGACMASWAVYRRLRPSETYGLFLCHHKYGAGALSRFIKMKTLFYSSTPVFLDSDNLSDLDALFEIIRGQTKSLVLVMTPQLLHRPWCAGEIATAFANQIRTLPLLCDDFQFSEDDSLIAIPETWNAKDKDNLAAFGITTDLLRDAFKSLPRLQSLTMPRFGNFDEQERSITELLATCGIGSFQPAKEDKSAAMVCIASLTSDPECFSTCQVVQLMLQKSSRTATRVLREARFPESCEVLVVVLWREVLDDECFASVMMQAAQATNLPSIVIIHADQNFVYPGAAFYEQPSMRCLMKPGFGPEMGPALAAVYNDLFANLAMPFTPTGAVGLQTKQIDEIIQRRFKKRYLKALDPGKLPDSAPGPDAFAYIEESGLSTQQISI